MNIPRIIFSTVLICLLSPSPSRAQQSLYDSYYSGNYVSVIQETSRAIENGDTLFNTFYLKALAEAQLGQTENVIQTLLQARDKFPGDRRIKTMLAGQYYNAGAFAEARDLFSGLIESDSTDIASLLKLAEIASFSQNYKEAVPILEKILVFDAANLSGLLMMGEILTRKNDSSAIVYYERAYGIYPENQNVTYALGNMYIQAKSPDKCVPICEKILEKDSTNIKFQKLLGLAYYKMGEPVSSIKHFKKALLLGDSSVFTLKFLGISHYMTVNFQSAIESLQSAVKIDSMDAEMHFFLGASLAGTTQKKKAMFHLDQSLEIMKPDPAVCSRIYSEQGNIMRLEMKYEKAYELYNLAWETDTTNLMALYLMASILDNSMHRSKEALVDYQRYIDQVDLLPKTESKMSQIPSIRSIVEDRIIALKEELFFLDER